MTRQNQRSLNYHFHQLINCQVLYLCEQPSHNYALKLKFVLLKLYNSQDQVRTI